MTTKPYPVSLLSNSELEKYLKLQIKLLREEIINEVEREINNKDLIQFKGYINIKSIFTLKLDKFKDFLSKNIITKLDKFLKKYLFKGIETFEEEINMNLLGVKFTTNKITDSINYKILKKDMLNQVKGLNERLVNKLKSEIFNGVINGESITSIKKRINNTFGKEYTYAETMARTEANNLLSQGEYLAAKQSGLNLRKYLSVHYDNRTSSICRELGRKYGTKEQSIPLTEKFKWNTGKGGEKLRPPFHPNERTALVFVQQEEYNKLK